MTDSTQDSSPNAPQTDAPKEDKKEYGGPKGAEPTRFGDWCLKGKCVDF